MTTPTYEGVGLAFGRALCIAQARATLPAETADQSDDESWEVMKSASADVELVMITVGAVAEAIAGLADRITALESKALGPDV